MYIYVYSNYINLTSARCIVTYVSTSGRRFVALWAPRESGPTDFGTRLCTRFELRELGFCRTSCRATRSVFVVNDDRYVYTCVFRLEFIELRPITAEIIVPKVLSDWVVIIIIFLFDGWILFRSVGQLLRPSLFVCLFSLSGFLSDCVYRPKVTLSANGTLRKSPH